MLGGGDLEVKGSRFAGLGSLVSQARGWVRVKRWQGMDQGLGMGLGPGHGLTRVHLSVCVSAGQRAPGGGAAGAEESTGSGGRAGRAHCQAGAATEQHGERRCLGPGAVPRPL